MNTSGNTSGGGREGCEEEEEEDDDAAGGGGESWPPWPFGKALQLFPRPPSAARACFMSSGSRVTGQLITCDYLLSVGGWGAL